MDGILNIRKPGGMTSFDVVRRIKRAAQEKHVGHGGTLDPLAEGVLPIFLGRGTRILVYLDDTAKIYRAVVRLGVTTDTYDADGTLVEERDATYVTREAVGDALRAFQGAILQTPPMYSAVHHQGRRLYDLARAGIEVERTPRPVTIHNIAITAWEPPDVTLEVTCSKGTYIRTLAADLGQALGCGASLKALERTRTGPFRIEDSYSLGAVEQALPGGGAPYLLPIDHPLSTWPELRLDAQQASNVCMGKSIHMPPLSANASQGSSEDMFTPPHAGLARAIDPEGRFLAILAWEESTTAWRPEKVFP